MLDLCAVWCGIHIACDMYIIYNRCGGRFSTYVTQLSECIIYFSQSQYNARVLRFAFFVLMRVAPAIYVM